MDGPQSSTSKGRWLLRSLVASSFLGCGEATLLRDTPIVGGSAQERRDARAELTAFEGWIGEGRLRLRRVAFESPEEPNHDGNQRGRTIVVRPGLGSYYSRRVLRHELCHALDWDEGLSHEVEGRSAFRDPVFDPLLDQDQARHGDALREVIARVCEAGPTDLHALAEPCPSEDPAVGVVAAWVLNAIYVGARPPPATDLGVGDWTTWTAPDGVTDLIVIGTGDPDVVVVRGEVLATGATKEWHVDAHTAAEIAPVTLPVGGDDPVEWALLGDGYVARGEVVGSRHPGVLSTSLIAVWTEARLVEAHADEVAFPEVPVCLPGADLHHAGPRGGRIRAVRTYVDAASWAELVLPGP